MRQMNLNDYANLFAQDQIPEVEFRELIQQFPKQDVVNRLYTSQFGFPAIKTIANTTEFPQKFVQNTLHGNDLYTRFKKPFPVKENKYRTITSNHVDEIWSADCVYMKGDIYTNKRRSTPLQIRPDQNEEASYILNIIDLFSRFVWSFPLKALNGRNIAMF
jgi:hypothetical protein